MAETMHDLLRALHISTGFVGLAAFWIPALARKGGRLHVAAGRVFSACAYVVALTALGSTSWALLHPASWAGEPVRLGEIPPDQIMFVAILGFLGLLLLGGVETGVRAMRTRHQPERFVGWRLRFLGVAQAVAALALFVFGLFHVVRSGGGLFWIPVALGGASFAGYFLEDRRMLANPRPTPMAWWYTHMGGMIGSGIAFHTAFLVFGGQRLWGGALMQGAWSFLPWILPSVLGFPALHFWTRYYKRKFGEMPAQIAQASTLRGSVGAKAEPTGATDLPA
ncbi:MAG: hypothetical protein OXF93_21880 [Acidobacteria bacterium]|nr:hypothetical protein [Acidobacteriota bacterium]